MLEKGKLHLDRMLSILNVHRSLQKHSSRRQRVYELFIHRQGPEGSLVDSTSWQSAIVEMVVVTRSENEDGPRRLIPLKE